MQGDMKTDVLDIITSAIDKFTSEGGIDLEGAAKLAKDKMDKKYGAYWHCIMGEGFSYQISAQVQSTMYVYFGKCLGVLMYKC